ncbi:flagellar hook-basal body complex protein FliE [Thalassococcus sp. BH17M4-6]|uniref:flagellar hook-basal body complex protein FliE n=1 Tax=Thalassococcus sp. BH17M4-6 TaxID=3413148 RepID=UPI003BC085FB
MDVRSLFAAQKYAAALPNMAPDPAAAGPQAAAANAAKDFIQTLQETEATAQSAMIGGADPHALVQALAQSEIAVEAAVAVRNKVVEAYQEILRMPV